MASILAAVTLPHVSGLPRNNVVNTFAFRTSNEPWDATLLGQIHADLIIFYNTTPAGSSQPVGGFIGEQIARTTLGVVVRYYDLTGHLDGSRHGSPIGISSFTLATSGVGIELPSELACCMSFNSAYGSDPEFLGQERPRAQDRGRIYLGPITTQALIYSSTDGRTSLTTAIRDCVMNAGVRLRDSSFHNWAVWSRRDAALKDVQRIWVDDAVDIQRRRGEAAVARTTSP